MTGATDPLYEQAVALVREHKRGSISLVQRHLRIGYNRAHAMIDAMVGTVLTDMPPVGKVIPAGVTVVCGSPAPKPACTVCGTAYEKHGSYPTCASHPYTPDDNCQHVIGARCVGAECRNGCVRGRGNAGVKVCERPGGCVCEPGRIRDDYCSFWPGSVTHKDGVAAPAEGQPGTAGEQGCGFYEGTCRRICAETPAADCLVQAEMEYLSWLYVLRTAGVALPREGQQ